MGFDGSWRPVRDALRISAIICWLRPPRPPAKVSVNFDFSSTELTSTGTMWRFSFNWTPARAQCDALSWLADPRSTLQARDTICEWKLDGNPDLAVVVFSVSLLLLCRYEGKVIVDSWRVAALISVFSPPDLHWAGFPVQILHISLTARIFRSISTEAKFFCIFFYPTSDVVVIIPG